MKLFIALLLFSSAAFADVTATWTPGAVVPDVPVDEYRLYCAPLADVYGLPTSILAPTTTLIFTLLDGANKCAVTSVSNINFTGVSLESVFSNEVIFYVSGGEVTNPRPNAPGLVII